MDRCSQCPAVHNCLPADGPRGDCLFIGEAPGKDEDKGFKSRGIPPRIFIGKTGQEVDQHYLPLAGLNRRRVRVINAISCLPNTPGHKLDVNRNSHKNLLMSCCNAHLYPEIAESNPKLLVPMGALACHAIDPAINLELQHGIPCMTRWGIMAFPMNHPAYGLHSPKEMLKLRLDWIRLKRYLAGTLRVPVDEYPEPDYAELTDPRELLAVGDGGPLAIDTESSPSLGPYVITYSLAAGTGRLIRTSRRDLLDAFQAVLSRHRGPILVHNWLYDARVLAELNLSVPRRLLRDTMARTYHLGHLPQGLKAIAYRELGMQMEDFEDLVKPHSVPKVLDYYTQAAAITWPKPEPELVRDEQGKWKVYSAQSMNTKLKRFFTDYRKSKGAKDVFQMWEKNWTEEQPMIEAELGPFPQMDIAHVPFEKTLYYACRDVDALQRYWPLLERMTSRVHLPVEEWAA